MSGYVESWRTCDCGHTAVDHAFGVPPGECRVHLCDCVSFHRSAPVVTARWSDEVVALATTIHKEPNPCEGCLREADITLTTLGRLTPEARAALGVIPPDPESVPLIAAVTLADWLEGWCEHEDGATNGPECCVWRKEAATVRNLASQIPAFPLPPDPVVAAIREDAVWLAKLARGSSWPGEMADQVERAANRVIEALS